MSTTTNRFRGRAGRRIAATIVAAAALGLGATACGPTPMLRTQRLLGLFDRVPLAASLERAHRRFLLGRLRLAGPGRGRCRQCG
ncbi:hypothetical protein SANTM175S_01756 [Streptomyces antimycoticus]